MPAKLVQIIRINKVKQYKSIIIENRQGRAKR